MPEFKESTFKVEGTKYPVMDFARIVRHSDHEASMTIFDKNIINYVDGSTGEEFITTPTEVVFDVNNPLDVALHIALTNKWKSLH